MKKAFLKLFFGFIACMMFACDKDQGSMPTSFELLSINYIVENVVPVKDYVFDAVYDNSLHSTQVTWHCPIHTAVHSTSFFSSSDIIENTNINELEVELPLLNLQGELLGNSSRKNPFTFGVINELRDSISYIYSLEVPPNTTYNSNVVNLGYHVYASFCAQVKNIETGNIITLMGSWNGILYIIQKISIIDADGNVIKHVEKFIYT